MGKQPLKRVEMCLTKMIMLSNERADESKTLKEDLASAVCNKKGRLLRAGIFLSATDFASIRNPIPSRILCQMIRQRHTERPIRCVRVV